MEQMNDSSSTRQEARSRQSTQLRQSRRPRQSELPFAASGWGGRRRGAGRKPKGERALHPHVRRPERNSRHPLHVTSRIHGGLPSLRQARAHALLLSTLRAGADQFGFRLVEFSVQSNHLHLIVEADDRIALTRGTRALLVRLARNLNRLWCRRGAVFADRYHAHELKSPAEVRRALAYVLHNARRHGALGAGIDPFSSGPWFDGFRERGGPRADFIEAM
ncbi:MAG: hypothetical protein EPO68_14185, partial [Planctomycetota bacterium]